MPIHEFDRRRLLQLLLAAGFTNSVRSSSAKSANKLKGKRVVVIGAGIAGLSAAQILQSSGAGVTVLEARHRIGGRIATDTSLGVPFELGAAWIHGPSRQNPLMKLLGKNRKQTFVTDESSIAVYDRGGKKLSRRKLQRVEKRWQRLIGQIDQEYVESDHESLFEAIQYLDEELLKDDGVRWALSAYTEFSTGGPISQLSAALHDDDLGFSGEDVILKNGMSEILEPLVKNLDILTGKPVSHIKYDGEGVTILTGSERYSADYAIVSVPLGVLKAGSIQFDPQLPAGVSNAIDNIGFGSVSKIALKFPRAFWPVKTQYFGIYTRPHGRWNFWLNYRTFSSENILHGFSFGKYAQSADKMNEEERLEHALNALQQVWGDKVGKPDKVLATSWSTDPFAWGAYSFPARKTTKSDYDKFAEPVADRIFFAGEHTLFDYYASMHGALMSGRRAAKRILAAAI